MRATASLIDRIRGAGVSVGNLKEGMAIAENTSFEMPVRVTKNIRWDTRVNVGAYSLVHGPGELVACSIGRYCSIAPGSTIGANEHAIGWLSTSSLFENASLLQSPDVPLTRTGRAYSASINRIDIGNDVWIGQNCFIKGGVTIGDGAIIGGMSNVISDVPPYAIYGGNPARLIRYRFGHLLIHRLLQLSWWRFDLDQLLQFDFHRIEIAVEQLEAAVSAGLLNERRLGLLCVGAEQ